MLYSTLGPCRVVEVPPHFVGISHPPIAYSLVYSKIPGSLRIQGCNPHPILPKVSTASHCSCPIHGTVSILSKGPNPKLLSQACYGGPNSSSLGSQSPGPSAESTVVSESLLLSFNLAVFKTESVGNSQIHVEGCGFTT